MSRPISSENPSKRTEKPLELVLELFGNRWKIQIVRELLGRTRRYNELKTAIPELKGKYDAWNRLVEVRDTSDNLIASYEYNGLNQRIKKTVGATVTQSFFNEKWQELESQAGSELTTYVWGNRYIDDLVLREKGEERLYSLADPN